MSKALLRVKRGVLEGKKIPSGTHEKAKAAYGPTYNTDALLKSRGNGGELGEMASWIRPVLF